jgi:hypothetical protein
MTDLTTIWKMEQSSARMNAVGKWVTGLIAVQVRDSGNYMDWCP